MKAIQCGVVFIPGFNGSKMIRTSDPMYNATFYTHLPGSRRISVTQWRNEMKVLFQSKTKSYTVSDDIRVDCSNPYDLTSIRDLSHELDNVDKLIKKFKLPTAVNHFIKQYFSYEYFGPVIDALKKKDSHLTMACVPYDFRTILLPQDLAKFDQALKHLCEDVKQKSANEKTIIICHSLGGLLGYRFLATCDPLWVKDNIKAFVSISTPYGGISSLYRCMISGYYYIYMYKSIYGNLIREFSGFIACLPNLYAYGNDDVLVWDQCARKGYTRRDLQHLCATIGAPTYDIQQFFAQSLKEIHQSMQIALPSSIPVVSIFTSNENTESSFVYSALKKGFNNDPVETFTEPGDGLVIKKSLCALYEIHKNNNLNYSFVDIQDNQSLLGHTSIIMHPKVIAVLKTLI